MLSTTVAFFHILHWKKLCCNSQTIFFFPRKRSWSNPIHHPAQRSQPWNQMPLQLQVRLLRAKSSLNSSRPQPWLSSSTTNQTVQVCENIASKIRGSAFSFIKLHEVLPACHWVSFKQQLYPVQFSQFK